MRRDVNGLTDLPHLSTTASGKVKPTTSLTVVRKDELYAHKVRGFRAIGRRIKGSLWGSNSIVMEIEPDVQRSVELLATWGDKIEEAMHEAMLVDSYKMQVNLDGEEEDKPVNQKVATIIKEGYMRKRKTGNNKLQDLKRSWERRYCVLYNDGKLRYYDSRDKAEEKGSLDLRFFALHEEDEDLEIDDEEEGEERQSLKLANQFFKIEKGKQFGLHSGQKAFFLASPERAVADEWIATLQTTLAILYQKSPIFSQDFLRVSLMDGTFTTMVMDEATRTRDVVRYMCKKHCLNNESEWGLIEQWDHPGLPGGTSERKLPNDELLLDQTVLAWEHAARKRYGLVSMVPQLAFQLVLRKQTSLLPHARTKKEQHLEFCQALADMREGRFTTGNKEEVFELAGLAIFKDLHEGIGDGGEAEDMKEIVLEEGQLTGQLHHYLPYHWFRSLEAKRSPVQKQTVADWDGAVVRAFNDLTRGALDEIHHEGADRFATPTRKIVAAFRMETEMNAVAATRMIIERVRLAPLCFSAQYVAEMWSVDKILKILVVINYGGLHIYRLGASPTLLSTFDFNTLVSWQSMNDMLIINIIYAAKGEVNKRREKLRFLTRESIQMRTLLSRYAEVVLADLVKKMKLEGAHGEATESY
jgi:Zn/Cd-binding protein ZinT